MRTLDARVVGEVKGWNDKKDKIENESDNHHLVATVELVVNQERGHVIPDKRHADIDQIIQPTDHDRVVVRQQSVDELRLEEFVAVEEHVIGKPSTTSRDETWTKVRNGQLERLGIVASDIRLALGNVELLRRSWHLVGSKVAQPKRAERGNRERHSIGPLGGDLRVGWVTRSVVEDEQKQDEQDLIDELTPALHEKCRSDFATTVQAIVASRDSARANSVLHTRSGCHGIFSAHTETIDEECPGIAYDPAVLSHTPSCGEHDKTQEHNDGVLYQTPSSA